MRIPFLIFNLLLISFQSSIGQQLYLHIFSANDDSKIGTACGKTAEIAKNSFLDMIGKAGIDISQVAINEPKFEFSIDGINKYVNWTKELQPNDIAILYVAGWGWKSNDAAQNNPDLLFKKDLGTFATTKEDAKKRLGELANNIKNFGEIQQALKSSPARLTIAIADAGNRYFHELKEQLITSSFAPISPVYHNDKSAEHRCKEFLLKSKGNFVILGSMRGYHSYISESNGSFLVHALSAAIEEAMQKNYGVASWEVDIYSSIVSKLDDWKKDSLVPETQEPDYNSSVKTEAYIASGIHPDPYLKKKFNFLDFFISMFYPIDQKIKKQWKNAFKDGKVGNFLMELKFKEEARGRVPAIWVASMSILSGLEGSNFSLEDQYKYTSMMVEICKNRKLNFSKRDETIEINIIRKVQKYAKEGSELAQELQKHSGNLCACAISREKKLKNDLVNTIPSDKDIIRYQDLILKYNEKQQENIEKINALEDSINLYTGRLQEIDKERIEIQNWDKDKAKVSVDIKNTFVTPNIRKDLEQYLDCRLEGKTNMECPTSYTLTKSLADKEVVLNFSPSPSAYAGLSAKNFPLGKACVQSIEDIVSIQIKVFKSFWPPKLPKEYKEQLVVKLEIIGYADWRGAGGYLGNKYNIPNTYLGQSYLDRFRLEHTPSFHGGQYTKITNLELAFLRAYCAYISIKNHLKYWGVEIEDPTKFQVKFVAIEQAKSEVGTSGDDYRGVFPILEIENLAQIKQEHIDALSREEKRIQRKIDAWALEVENLEIQNKRWNDLRTTVKDNIEEFRNKKKNIVTKIRDNGPNGKNVETEFNRIESAINKHGSEKLKENFRK